MDPKQNLHWDANEQHALDVYSISIGTMRDISFCIDVLPLYLGYVPSTYACMGFSLGGHVTLLALANGFTDACMRSFIK